MKLIFKGTRKEYDRVLEHIVLEGDICPNDLGFSTPDCAKYCCCTDCWKSAIEFEEEKEIKGMKELTTEVTLRLTAIERGTEEEIDQVIQEDLSERGHREFIKTLKDTYGFDDVRVVGLQHFVNDIREEEPEQQVDGIDYDKLADKVIEKLMDRYVVKNEVFFEDNMEE